MAETASAGPTVATAPLPAHIRVSYRNKLKAKIVAKLAALQAAGQPMVPKARQIRSFIEWRRTRGAAAPASLRRRHVAAAPERPSWLDRFLTQGGPGHG
jgi:hypothetical protein